MEQNLLSWNIENWITVLLMVALGYLLVSLVGNYLLKATGTSAGAAPQGGSGLSLVSNFNLAAA